MICHLLSLLAACLANSGINCYYFAKLLVSLISILCSRQAKWAIEECFFLSSRPPIHPPSVHPLFCPSIYSHLHTVQLYSAPPRCLWWPLLPRNTHWPALGYTRSPRRKIFQMGLGDWVINIWWWPNDPSEGAAGHRQSWCVTAKVLVSSEVAEHTGRQA